ncbi:hypothetical protein CGRA01v4_07466 [Colletotrichum graminicola]|nr:hypothetical protein CGRA01v4_07466 [Colletotrichum graminicola]
MIRYLRNKSVFVSYISHDAISRLWTIMAMWLYYVYKLCTVLLVSNSPRTSATCLSSQINQTGHNGLNQQYRVLPCATTLALCQNHRRECYHG